MPTLAEIYGVNFTRCCRFLLHARSAGSRGGGENVKTAMCDGLSSRGMVSTSFWSTPEGHFSGWSATHDRSAVAVACFESPHSLFLCVGKGKQLPGIPRWGHGERMLVWAEGKVCGRSCWQSSQGKKIPLISFFIIYGCFMHSFKRLARDYPIFSSARLKFRCVAI